MLRSTRRFTTTALGVAALIATISGCTASSTTTTQSAAPQASLTENAATGAPISIGFLNPSRGPNSYPESGPGAEGAVNYINKFYGGLNGRPINMVDCETEATPESVLSCANKFVESKVVAVITGNTFNDGAALPVLESAGIPLIGNVPQDSATVASQDSFYTGPAQAVFAIAPLQFFKDQGKKSVALLQGDVPVNHEYVDTFMEPVSKKLGIDFQAVYYDPETPNWPTLASTLVSTGAEVVGTIALPENQCTDMVRALRDQGFTGDILAGACTTFATTLPPSTEGSDYIYSGMWLPATLNSAPQSAADQIKIFNAAMADAGHADARGLYAAMSFSSFVTMADILKSVQGDITSASIAQAYDQAIDVPSFLGPNISCDHTVWPGQSACSNQLLMLKAGEAGEFAPVSDPPFTAVDPSIAS